MHAGVARGPEHFVQRMRSNPTDCTKCSLSEQSVNRVARGRTRCTD
jgi:hypothetical protein